MPSKLLPALLASLALPLAAQQQAPATDKTDAQAAAASASPTTGAVTTLDTIMVYGESENDSVIQNPFLMPVEGTRIFAGKRATVIDLDALPKVQANNYRQALALTPGLLVSEETTPLVSIGYRGIGTPNRTQFMQVLKDGIPIHADPFGYPEAYYTPPLDVVDRIEFIRGGGSLMYGPQPAGTLNYITYMPDRKTPFSFRTQNIGGTDGFFSNYTAITGTSGKVGYYGYYNHRQSQGFRTDSSDYRLDGGHFKLSYDIDQDSRWILALDAYEQENDEPGGLNYRDYVKNRDRATRSHDYFHLSRYVASAEFQHKIQTGTELDVKFWTGYYNRYSHRQRLSAAQGTNAFGVTPLGTQSNIEDQTFYSYGFEPRIRHDWEGLGGKHTLAAGMQFYLMDSPRTDKRGLSGPAASDGVTTGDAQRDVFYYSFFAENKFTWGNFTLTPGLRLESITQSVWSKTYNSVPGGKASKRDVTKRDFQPLFGLGISYDLPAETQVYANVSQSYRPAIFSESVINTPGTTATDSDPGLGWSYELGFRGNPRQWFNFDTSLFLIDLDNRFAVSNNILGSAGRSINYGLDAAFQIDLIGATDAVRGSSLASRLGSLSYYGNVTLLNAQIHGGPNDGSTPQFAPEYMLRTGLIYGFKGIKVSFLGTFVADHKAQDSNKPEYDIPAYMTWDLTAEVPVTKNFSVMAGINNVFNEDYYSRITSSGIDPAYGRNFYLGASFQF